MSLYRIIANADPLRSLYVSMKKEGVRMGTFSIVG